jgi:hypothetical protein
MDQKQQEESVLSNASPDKAEGLEATEPEREQVEATEETAPVDADAASASSEKKQKLEVLADSFLSDLQECADKVEAERQGIEATKAQLVIREQALKKAEAEREAGYSNERALLDTELFQKRQGVETELTKLREEKLSSLEQEILSLKAARLAEVDSAENAERARIRAEIQNERDAWSEEREQQLDLLRKERDEFEQKRGVVSAQLNEVERRAAELQDTERHLEKKDERLREQAERRGEKLEEEIADRCAELKATYEARLAAAREDNARIRGSLQSQESLLNSFEELKRQLGDVDPAVAIRELNSTRDEIARLKEDLATRPTDELRQKYEETNHALRQKDMRIEELVRQLAAGSQSVAEANDLRHKISVLNDENEANKQRATICKGMANEATAELDRLRAAYERPAEIAARYKEIEMPHIEAAKVIQPIRSKVDELSWLSGIGTACDKYGLHFNPRIVKAFHTALKTSEWSPLTVLAGVSGTGKSELPRLYSHFGGLYFEPLAVQPNWDSQESMLGFFNSIDNKFDAQPVLRFLAQSQKSWVARTDDNEGYPGLADATCMILLDEMNLAHPELYFAEFLSKLELRRGRKSGDVPRLPVKIGAGMHPYQLPLGRNVLWVGTMNQDETTKSLSDKVLDRSIIIYFPRPTELKRRLKLQPLDENNRGVAIGASGMTLHKAAWQSWLAQGSNFTDEEVKPFKEFIESMNASLAVAGRAIGHRVWQSVEYYMANYPDVRAAGEDRARLAKAMHIAFEDQLVQKVMPKLRGIDTRGKSKDECLDKIRGQLIDGIGGNGFNLTEDFDLACELGYGQFIWQSANYLKEDSDIGYGAAPATTPEVANDSNTPVSKLRIPEDVLGTIGDPDRAQKVWGSIADAFVQGNFISGIEQANEQWDKYRPEQKAEMIRNFGRQVQQ